MKVQILGTAAAEGWPALFCACEPCQRARRAGGKNIRSRASVMVNDNIKIDFNADSFHHAVTNDLDYSKLDHILFTHSHNDHFAPGELEYLRDPFAHCRHKDTIDIWANSSVTDIFKQNYANVERLGLILHDVTPFETIDLDGLKATPVIAVHKQGEVCLNWLLGELDNCVLYASDTGPYNDDTLDFLKNVKLDLVVSECTFGFNGVNSSHMSVISVIEMREKLEKQGSLKAGCPFVITHFSHNAGYLHDEMVEKTQSENLVVAYDGIILEGGS